MGDQALMQLAAEQRDAVGAGVVAEEMAGHAALAAAAGAEHVLFEPGPVLDSMNALAWVGFLAAAGGWLGANELRWSPVEGAADYAVRVSDARGQVRFQDTVKGTQVALPPTIRCSEPGLSVSVSAHSDRRVPGPPTSSSRGNCRLDGSVDNLFSFP